MKKSQYLRKPHRIRKKNSVLKNRFFRRGILFLIFGVVIFYLLIFSPVFQVEKIIIINETRSRNNETWSREAIKNVIQKEVETKILFFPTKSIFLVSPSKIRQGILNNFPEIDGVEIRRRFPDGLDVVVAGRLAIASWCQENQCFLLDTEGKIFEEITAASAGLPAGRHGLVNIKAPDFNEALKPGDRVIEKERLSQILKIVSELKEGLKIPVDFAEFVSGGRLNIKTEGGWEIYFNLQGDVDWQLTELDLLLENKIPSEERERLEYVDLRFNRVYYKFRQE